MSNACLLSTFGTDLAQLVSLLSRAKRERDRAPVMNIDIIEDCHELYSDLEGWTENLSDLSARVHAGNTIYAKGGQVSYRRARQYPIY